MPWSSEPLRPDRVFRTAWSGAPLTVEAPPHQMRWTGIKKASAGEPAGAVAVLERPELTSGVVVHLPAGVGHSFPHRFPYQFVAGPGTLSAGAELFAPHVGVGVGKVFAPDLTAAASVEIPGVTSGATVVMPAGAPWFPHRFPVQFGPAPSSLTAGAELLPPTVTVDNTVTVPELGAVAEVGTPLVSSGAGVDAPDLVAVAALDVPTVGAGATAGVPELVASAAVDSPTVTSGAVAKPPAMDASAALLTPDIIVEAAPAVEAVEFTAGAELHTPMVQVIITVEAPHLVAQAGGEKWFPHQFPVMFATPSGFLDPSVVSGAEPASPVAAASASMETPLVGLGAEATPPVLAATAAVETPTPRSGTSGGAPAVAASAAVNAPTLHLDQFVTVTGNGRTTVPVWARYIDVVLLGGGASGANGSLFGTGNGGRPGMYLTARWDRNAFPGVELGSLNIAIGGGGSGNNGAGGGTTIWIDAYDTTTYSGETRTANGGSGTNSGRDAQGPGNQNFNGISAVGGGGNGAEPGSGGRGGASGFSGTGGEAGAKGRAWIRFSV